MILRGIRFVEGCLQRELKRVKREKGSVGTVERGKSVDELSNQVGPMFFKIFTKVSLSNVV